MDISIIIPCNQDRGWLKDAVKSCEDQVFSGTHEIIIQYNDATVGKNMNDGFAKCSGQWIKKLDEDDMLPPDALQNLWDYAQGGYDWVYGDAWQFYGSLEDHALAKSQAWFTLPDLMQRNVLHGGALLYHRRTFEITGGWDEELETAEEYDWHLLLTAKNFQRGYIPKVVYWQRMHEGSKYNYYTANHDTARRRIREGIIRKYESYVQALYINPDEFGAVPRKRR